MTMYTYRVGQPVRVTRSLVAGPLTLLPGAMAEAVTLATRAQRSSIEPG